MKLALIALLALTGCADLTPREKTGIEFGVSVIAVGAVMTYQERNGHSEAFPKKGIEPVNCVGNRCD